MAEGKADGKADALLLMLTARGFDVPDEVERRVRACTDLKVLDTWTRRAAVVTSLDDLLT